jgi:hypothetical protein
MRDRGGRARLGQIQDAAWHVVTRVFKFGSVGMKGQ